MNKKGRISAISIKLAGAICGSIGFFLIAYQMTIAGTALIGLGSLLIASGEQW